MPSQPPPRCGRSQGPPSPLPPPPPAPNKRTDDQTQYDESQSLLSGSNEASFTRATVEHGIRTTPIIAAVPRKIGPTPTAMKNAYAALAETTPPPSPPRRADSPPPTRSEFDNFCRESADLLKQHRSQLTGVQERFEQAHKRSWRGLVMDLDDKCGAYDKELAALKAQSVDTLDRLHDHQSIPAQHQTALNMLTGHGLDHDKRLSTVEKLLLHYDLLL